MCEGYMTCQGFPQDLCRKCPTGCQAIMQKWWIVGGKWLLAKNQRKPSFNAGTVNLVSKKIQKPCHSFCIQMLELPYLQRGKNVSKGLFFLVRMLGPLKYLMTHEKYGQRCVQNWLIFNRSRMRVIQFSHVFFLVGKLDPHMSVLSQCYSLAPITCQMQWCW